VRIASLLPAATDLVATLDRLPDLVARTHECDWPPGAVDGIPIVTTTEIDPDAMSSREISDAVGGANHRGSSLYTLDTDLLARLAPDLVLTQDLCEVCAVSYRRVSEVMRTIDADTRVISLEPHTLDGILACVEELGDVLAARNTATRRITELRNRLAAVRAAVAGQPRPRVAAIEWLDPVWPAGHWVPEQIEHAGGIPLLAEAGEHTKPIEWQQVVDAQPDVLLLLPCGFPPQRTLAEAHVLTERDGWSDLPAVRTGQVWVLDGPAYFNRPGPRVVRGVEILATVLHGDPTEAHRLTATRRT
jgi:iron complex transport system substrate-binding protein